MRDRVLRRGCDFLCLREQVMHVREAAQFDIRLASCGICTKHLVQSALLSTDTSILFYVLLTLYVTSL